MGPQSAECFLGLLLAPSNYIAALNKELDNRIRFSLRLYDWTNSVLWWPNFTGLSVKLLSSYPCTQKVEYDPLKMDAIGRDWLDYERIISNLLRTWRSLNYEHKRLRREGKC